MEKIGGLECVFALTAVPLRTNPRQGNGKNLRRIPSRPQLLQQNNPKSKDSHIGFRD
jgi:hypothetical protein